MLENVLYLYRSVLFAVSDNNTVGPVMTEYRTGVIDEPIKFCCLSRKAAVDLRCREKTLIMYRSGAVRFHDSELYVEIRGNWTNFTITVNNVTAADLSHCFCFQAKGGPLIREFVTTFVAGIFYTFVLQCILSVLRTYAVNLCLQTKKFTLVLMLSVIVTKA